MGLIGIKYCGGCNPRIERERLVRELEKLLSPDNRLEIIRVLKDYPIAVLICGCEVTCANRPAVGRLARKWIVVGGPAVDLQAVSEGELAGVIVRKIKAYKNGVEI